MALALTSHTAVALTLEEAIQQSSGSSHEIKQLRLQADSAQLAETKAMAGFMPRLDFNAHHLFSEKFQELEIEFGGANFTMPAIQPYSSADLTASVEIFGGFKTVNELEAAKLASAAEQHRLTRAELKLRAQIRTLFYRALGSQVLVEVSEQNIHTLQSHMKDVLSRLRGGVSTKFDTLRVEVQLEEAQSEKISVENAAVVARAQLFEAIGLEDDHRPLAGKLPENLAQYDISKINLKDVRRDDRQALTLETDEYAYLAKAAQAHWSPHVSLFGSREWYNNINHSIWESDQRFKDAYSVGVALKWNLFDGGADLASQRQAALAQQISDEKLKQLDQAIPVNLEEAQRRLSYDVINYQTKIVSIKKAEEAVRLARGALRAGTLTNTEVLDVVLDLNRAKAAAVKSQMDAIEAMGQLEMALGHQI
jgi:outer membrane protein